MVVANEGEWILKGWVVVISGSGCMLKLKVADGAGWMLKGRLLMVDEGGWMLKGELVVASEGGWMLKEELVMASEGGWMLGGGW